MLRLRNHLLSCVCAAFTLHRRLLSATATTPATPPTRFTAEEYLVATCGLTPSQAVKASKWLAHLKSPANPDTILSFLAGADLAKHNVTAGIARYPRLLCYKVDKTLTPRFTQILNIGLSPSQISRLISVAPNIFTVPSMISRLQFCLSSMGSFDLLHLDLKRNSYLLGQNHELVKPNIAFLLNGLHGPCALVADAFSSASCGGPEAICLRCG
ncbi:unnamed protein product [Urochloa humidicola]